VAIADVLAWLPGDGEDALHTGAILVGRFAVAEVREDPDPTPSGVVEHAIEERDTSAVVGSEQREEGPVREGREG
jgi:hypothetical protein